MLLGLTDYHTHSILSDGADSYEEMIRTATEKGLEEIGLTDHVCLKGVDWAIDPLDLPVMTTQILELRHKYRDRIRVKYGIEMDYLPGKEEEIAALTATLPVDYVIGSVHFIGEWNFDSDRSLYGKWPNDELYAMYFELIDEAVRSGLFDIIGHLDIIKKFRIYPETDQSRLIGKTLERIRDKGLCVELNTGSLDRPCADFSPSRPIIEQCCQLGIPLTLGSDAHYSSQVGRHFESARELLWETGYRELAVFNRRKRDFIRL